MTYDAISNRDNEVKKHIVYDPKKAFAAGDGNNKDDDILEVEGAT
jgi:hypothetical protein